MQYKERFNIIVLSDFNNFKNNMYSIFSLLPIKGVLVSNIESIYELDSILNEKKTDLIILNKASYTKDELEYLFNLDVKRISVIVIIDSYFKYKPLFMNFDKGIITIRRPLSINKFLEVLKIALFGNIKKKANNDLKSIRTIEMAKAFLVTYENMFEEDAHKYLESTAMNNRTTLYDEALKIVIKELLEREDIDYEYKNKF